MGWASAGSLCCAEDTQNPLGTIQHGLYLSGLGLGDGARWLGVPRGIRYNVGNAEAVVVGVVHIDPVALR